VVTPKLLQASTVKWIGDAMPPSPYGKYASREIIAESKHPQVLPRGY
jgi:hypothetical protein